MREIHDLKEKDVADYDSVGNDKNNVAVTASFADIISLTLCESCKHAA